MLDAGCGAGAHAGHSSSAEPRSPASTAARDSWPSRPSAWLSRSIPSVADFRDLLLARSGTSKDAELLVLRQEVAKPLAAPG